MLEAGIRLLIIHPLLIIDITFGVLSFDKLLIAADKVRCKIARSYASDTAAERVPSCGDHCHSVPVLR